MSTKKKFSGTFTKATISPSFYIRPNDVEADASDADEWGRGVGDAALAWATNFPRRTFTGWRHLLGVLAISLKWMFYIDLQQLTAPMTTEQVGRFVDSIKSAATSAALFSTVSAVLVFRQPYLATFADLDTRDGDVCTDTFGSAGVYVMYVSQCCLIAATLSFFIFCLMAGSVAVSELAFTMMFYFSRIGLHTKNGAYSSLPSLAGASAQYCGLPTSVRRPVSTPLHQHCAPPPQLPQHRRVLLSDHWHCTWFVVQLCARRGWVCLRRHSRLEDVYISLCGSQIRSLL
jgi:hypothetical protein